MVLVLERGNGVDVEMSKDISMINTAILGVNNGHFTHFFAASRSPSGIPSAFPSSQCSFKSGLMALDPV